MELEKIQKIYFVHCYILSQLVPTCFLGQSCDRVTDCTPSCIDCCQGDCVVTVLFQLLYSVAEIAICESSLASVLNHHRSIEETQ